MAISDILCDAIEGVEKYGSLYESDVSKSILKAMREAVRIQVSHTEEDLEMVFIPRKEYEALKDCIRTLQ
tara:strand:+ start:794 stop:1003 length:210 start_codon:yes stop_codon:yes gene_type:complete